MTSSRCETRALTIFYFDDDFEGGRMGTECAYALGIDSNGDIWSTIDDCGGFSRNMSEFEKSNIRFVKNTHVTVDDPIVEQILAGKQLADWKSGEMCYAGCGNFGICFGVATVSVDLAYASAALDT
jgi:hypothetical protein